MPRITDATAAWSSAVTLAAGEFWQCHAGYIAVSTAASPGPEDGIRLAEGQGVDIASGKDVKYRKLTSADAIISREAL